MLPIRVLLVEDDPDDRDLFFEFYSSRSDLQFLPFAENGFDLMTQLDAIADDSLLPSLIVLDQNMPKMNGKQTLAALREQPRYNPIVVVVYSTYADHELVEECMALGAKHVATKPNDERGYQIMMDVFVRQISPS